MVHIDFNLYLERKKFMKYLLKSLFSEEYRYLFLKNEVYLIKLMMTFKLIIMKEVMV